MSISRGRPQECKYVYKEADKYFEVNQDKELDTIRISLPKAPSYYLIDGYNLPPEEQYFRRVQIPDKLRQIERDARKALRKRETSNKNFKAQPNQLIDKFWEIFDAQRKYRNDQVAEFIKEIHWVRRHGYWFFNNGKPTFITGDYFDYLNFYTFVDEKSKDSGHPEYRDADRRRYLLRQYAERTTESVTVSEDGDVVVKDIGIRTSYGTAEPKFRRCGVTGQAVHKVMKASMEGFGRYGTIVSMEGDNAEVHYRKKLRPAFEDYPLWLKPKYAGSIIKGVNFDTTNNLGDDNPLKSVFDYTESGGERKNDGDKLHVALFDEEGKTMVANIMERWGVNKQAMSLGGGSNIIGFSIHPTTVEEMDVGGEEYLNMCTQSKFFERGQNGQTSSGLFELFIPAWDGTEGFIDKFGESVIDTPTPEQIDGRPDSMFARFGKGSRQYLQEQLDSLLAIGTPEAMESYRSLKRKLPMCYADCWLGSSGDLGFDMEIIDNRIAELRRNSKVRHGRFEWTNGFGSDVQFVDDLEGPFEVSLMLGPGEANQRMKIEEINHVTGDVDEHWAPKNPYRFTASADPFKAGTSNEAKRLGTHTRQSDGGLAILLNPDEENEKSDNIRDWDSYRFVCSYRYRPTSLKDYQEDALKMCIYYGAPFYPERNVGEMDVCFSEFGYGGYYLYDISPTTGRKDDKPGFASYEKRKGDLFVATKDYIRFRGHKEEHESYLQEVKNIKGVEQMNKYDRFTAHGGCLLGMKQNGYSKQRDDANSTTSGDVQSIVDFFTNM